MTVFSGLFGRLHGSLLARKPEDLTQLLSTWLCWLHMSVSRLQIVANKMQARPYKDGEAYRPEGALCVPSEKRQARTHSVVVLNLVIFADQIAILTMSDASFFETDLLTQAQIEEVLAGFEPFWTNWKRLKNAIGKVYDCDWRNRWRLVQELEQLVRECIDVIITGVTRLSSLDPSNPPNLNSGSLTEFAKFECAHIGAHVLDILHWCKLVGNKVCDAVIEHRNNPAAQTTALVRISLDPALGIPTPFGTGFRNFLNGVQLDTERRRRYWVLYELLAQILSDLDDLTTVISAVTTQAANLVG